MLTNEPYCKVLAVKLYLKAEPNYPKQDLEEFKRKKE